MNFLAGKMQFFFGWKSRAENEALSFFTENELLKIDCKFENEKFSFDAEKFSSLPLAIKVRIIFKGIDFVKASERIPYAFVSCLASGCFENAGCSECGGLEFSFCNGRFLIQKKRKVATESVFFVIIEKMEFIRLEKFLLKFFRMMMKFF